MILRGLVVLIWGSEPLNFPAALPLVVITIVGVPFYPAQLCLIGALALVTLAAWVFLRFTRLGMAMRAVASNETAALLAGVSVDRIHATAWMLSAAIAAVAGMLFALNFKLAPDMWFQGLKSFPAVILGGLDSVIGASLAGLIIGVIERPGAGLSRRRFARDRRLRGDHRRVDGPALRPVRQPRHRAGLIRCAPDITRRPSARSSRSATVEAVWGWTIALIAALLIAPFLMGAYALTLMVVDPHRRDRRGRLEPADRHDRTDFVGPGRLPGGRRLYQRDPSERLPRAGLDRPACGRR